MTATATAPKPRVLHGRDTRSLQAQIGVSVKFAATREDALAIAQAASTARYGVPGEWAYKGIAYDAHLFQATTFQAVHGA